MDLELEDSYIVVRAGSIPAELEERSFAVICASLCSHCGANSMAPEDID
jgi:hypothetical protein